VAKVGTVIKKLQALACGFFIIPTAPEHRSNSYHSKPCVFIKYDSVLVAERAFNEKHTLKNPGNGDWRAATGGCSAVLGTLERAG
jgi:hypothetical protein